MHPIRRLPVATVLAAGALLVGCGDDDEGEPATDDTPPAINTERPEPEAPVGPEDEVRTQPQGE